MGSRYSRPASLVTASLTGLLLVTGAGHASSHRDAPFVSQHPAVDGTDFYMFRSYEAGQDDTVTLIANYQPFQAPFSGPNYYPLDEQALYEIHIDNTGDGQEDLTFGFRFDNGQSGGYDAGDVNDRESYTATMTVGDRRTGSVERVTNLDDPGVPFIKPADNIGAKIVDLFGSGGYASYAQNFVYDVSMPACGTTGRLFVGQRAEGTVFNLGPYYDQISYNGDAAPITPDYARDAGTNQFADANVTSIAVEVPITCLQGNSSAPVVAGWTTASLRQARVLNPEPTPTGTDGPGTSVAGGAWTQVSRVGNPLVNLLMVDESDRDRFNALEPSDDAAIENAFTSPVVPRLFNRAFDTAVPETPRNDLVSVFLSGIDGLNRPASNSATRSEVLRLNTDVEPTPAGEQDSLGLLACDRAGYPNGRRPIDDVVDIVFSINEGALSDDNPLSLQHCELGESAQDDTVVDGSVVTDGALPDAANYSDSFPYLATPIAGASQ